MTKTFLVIVDDSKEMPVALCYAARRAKQAKGRVALLYVVEPDGIETWGGVEQAVMDHAFDEGREKMAQFEKMAEDISGATPVTFYRKGERRKVLVDLVDTQTDIAALVLAAQTHDGGYNPLIQYLTADKGIKKLRVPLIIVPETFHCDENEEA